MRTHSLYDLEAEDKEKLLVEEVAEARWNEGVAKEQEQEQGQEQEQLRIGIGASAAAASLIFLSSQAEQHEPNVPCSRKSAAHADVDCDDTAESLLISAVRQEAEDLRLHVANLVVARYVDTQDRESTPTPGWIQELRTKSW